MIFTTKFTKNIILSSLRVLCVLCGKKYFLKGF